jgi:hypothetical protein
MQLQLRASMEMERGPTLGGDVARGRHAGRADGHAGGAEGTGDGNHCDGGLRVGEDELGMDEGAMDGREVGRTEERKNSSGSDRSSGQSD